MAWMEDMRREMEFMQDIKKENVEVRRESTKARRVANEALYA